MTSRPTRAILKMAEALQAAARLDEVARVFCHSVRALDRQTHTVIELRGKAGHSRCFESLPKSPRKRDRLEGLAWRIQEPGTQINITIFRPGVAFDTSPRSIWSKLRQQAEPAFRRAIAYERMLDEANLLESELARAGSAMVLFGADGTWTSESDPAHGLLARHFPTDGQKRSILDSIRARLDLIQPQEKPAKLREVSTNAGILQFRARSAAEGHLWVLYITETEKSPNPEALQALGLTHRQAQVLHWVLQGKSNPEIAIILELGTAFLFKWLHQARA